MTAADFGRLLVTVVVCGVILGLFGALAGCDRTSPSGGSTPTASCGGYEHLVGATC